MGWEEFAQLLNRLRNSQLAASSYQKVSELLHEACALDGHVPPIWAQWLDVIEKFELRNSTNLNVWREIAHDIRALGFEFPLDLSGKRVGTITQTPPHA